MIVLRWFWLALVMFTASMPSFALSPDYIRVKDIILCDGSTFSGKMPLFTEASCRETQVYHFSPHKKQVWLKAAVQVPTSYIEAVEPLGLFVSAKVASEIYLNGRHLGRNGVPAATADGETPGKMDAVLYVPKGLLKLGKNEIIIRLSSHHGFVELAYPIHQVAIGAYIYPPDIALHGYLPSFVPLGILLAGALYFGAVALRRRDDRKMFLVPLVALFATGQLLAEVSRGLLQYDYPFHDIRLAIVMLCAAAGGLCLLLHVMSRFVRHKQIPIFGAAALLMVAAVYVEDTFGGKALLAIQVPAFVAAFLAALAARQQQAHAVSYAITLFVFGLVIGQVRDEFLDIYYYYIVAGLLMFLFAQQAHQVEEEKKQLAAEQQRADRLQQILDEGAEKKSPTSLKVSQAGKVELISTNQICYCKGARDYVELAVLDKGNVLHSGSLTELEKELPVPFLRVHRSYIVNSNFIQSLEREPSGSGTLLLTTGEQVPVSRRIMPKVRKALS